MELVDVTAGENKENERDITNNSKMMMNATSSSSPVRVVSANFFARTQAKPRSSLMRFAALAALAPPPSEAAPSISPAPATQRPATNVEAAAPPRLVAEPKQQTQPVHKPAVMDECEGDEDKMLRELDHAGSSHKAAPRTAKRLHHKSKPRQSIDDMDVVAAEDDSHNTKTEQEPKVAPRAAASKRVAKRTRPAVVARDDDASDEFVPSVDSSGKGKGRGKRKGRSDDEGDVRVEKRSRAVSDDDCDDDDDAPRRKQAKRRRIEPAEDAEPAPVAGPCTLLLVVCCSVLCSCADSPDRAQEAASSCRPSEEGQGNGRRCGRRQGAREEVR
jgi:hypothetical protein